MITITPSKEKTVPAVPLNLDLRDYFAGQALVAIIKAEESADVDSIKERARIRQRNHRAKFRDAKRAYAVADAMLAARSESGQ